MTIAQAPPATPYHRLARTAAHRWWRPVVGTLVVLAGSMFAGLLVLCVGFVGGVVANRPEGPDGAPTFGAIGDTALVLVFLAVATPVVLLTARWIQGRPAGSVSSVVGRLRLGWLGICVLLALPPVALTLLGGLGLLAATGAPMESGDEAWVGWGAFMAAMAMLVVLVPLQAAAEEYVCRGWLLQAVGVFVRNPWLAIMPQALVFAAAHGWGTPWGFLDLVVFGLLAGVLTVRTGGLEAAIALHLTNNVIMFGLAAALGVLDTDETAADAPWQVVAVDVLALSLFTLVVLWLARRRRLATVTPALPAGPAGPAPLEDVARTPAG